jgi:hypothetical protein
MAIPLERATRARLEHDGGFAWRNGQIHHRVQEVLGITALLYAANVGATSSSKLQGHSLQTWAGRLDFRNVTVAGHSFGGGTAVASAYLCATDGVERPFHFETAVILDGWMWPLMGDEMAVSTLRQTFGLTQTDPASTSSTRKPVSFLFLNAEQYLYNPQWETPMQIFVKECAAQGKHEIKRLLGGSVHQSFSDFPTIFGRISGAMDMLRGVLGGNKAEKRAHRTHLNGANIQEGSGDTIIVGSNKQKGPEALLRDAVSICVLFLEDRLKRENLMYEYESKL